MMILIDPATPTTVDLQAIGDRQFRVISAYRVTYTVMPELRAEIKTRCILIPAGFLTDLGSVPRLLRWVVSVASAPMPFVTHDNLYRDQRDTISRREADAVMLELMRYTGTPNSKAQRAIAWAGLRVGGWVGWKKNATR